MKDHHYRRKRISVSSWGLLVVLRCAVALFFVAGLTFSALRLYFTEFHPKLVSKPNVPAMEAVSSENPQSPAISIRETVIFPDQALVFLKYPPSTSLFTKDAIRCTYHLPRNSSQPQVDLLPTSLDNDLRIVRCLLPPRGAILSLALNGNNLTPGPTYWWDSLAYEAVIDDVDNDTVVFVKGLNLRSGRIYDESKFKCMYAQDSATSKFIVWADAVSAAQEVVRCKTPLSVLSALQKKDGDSIKVSVRVVGKRTLNSVARLNGNWRPVSRPKPMKQHQMCVCTMLRNQARVLPEWIVYHARIGVQRWFIYDNNSDDDIEDVVGSLVGPDQNVTRHAWPWIKSQEAGFAHCALRARDSCEWVGFIDVDEFLHLPSGLSLYDVVANQSSGGDDVAELRVSCHSFGPSGLKKVPPKGVTAGYTCRLAAPERHKSIVRPEALNTSLINMVHHFHLKSGFRHVNVDRSLVVINHYKYQVWEVFKEKFYRRVATYVTDWGQNRNVESKDRAPGLGTKAVEPLDWSKKFCQVKDTGLRDRILKTFTDPETGRLPWEDFRAA